MNIKINDYEQVAGFHSLGFFEKNYPMIEWIYVGFHNDEINLDVLKKRIENSLEEKKIVAIVIWEENIIGLSDDDKFFKFLNAYTLDPVWLITHLDTKSQLIYKFQKQLTCKIIEIPFWWLNDALCYYEVRSPIQTSVNSSFNYLCMTGRPEPSKLKLIKELEKHSLDQYGLITLGAPIDEFKNNKHIIINPHPPYQYKSETGLDKAAAQLYVNKTWISGNVENFLHIEKKYNDIPLVFSAESTVGISTNTEKSLWPILLGKMVLVYGRPGSMNYIQRFYDFDLPQYANLEFDQVIDTENQYTEEAHQWRVSKLVSDNVELVKNSHEIYKEFKNEIEQARWTIGKNLLNFCTKQVEQILEGKYESIS